jgi:hypothetical protein
MIFKKFSPKNLAFFAQTTAKFSQKDEHNIVFNLKMLFFSPKIDKNREKLSSQHRPQFLSDCILFEG